MRELLQAIVGRAALSSGIDALAASDVVRDARIQFRARTQRAAWQLVDDWLAETERSGLLLTFVRGQTRLVSRVPADADLFDAVRILRDGGQRLRSCGGEIRSEAMLCGATHLGAHPGQPILATDHDAFSLASCFARAGCKVDVDYDTLPMGFNGSMAIRRLVEHGLISNDGVGHIKQAAEMVLRACRDNLRGTATTDYSAAWPDHPADPEPSASETAAPETAVSSSNDDVCPF